MPAPLALSHASGSASAGSSACANMPVMPAPLAPSHASGSSALGLRAGVGLMPAIMLAICSALIALVSDSAFCCSSPTSASQSAGSSAAKKSSASPTMPISNSSGRFSWVSKAKSSTPKLPSQSGVVAISSRSAALRKSSSSRVNRLSSTASPRTTSSAP